LESDAVILDTETTGLLKQDPQAEIIELAIISVKGKKLYFSRFKPKYTIPTRTIEINGFKPSDVKSSPGFKDEYEKIIKILSGKVVIAYNEKFDRGMMERTASFFDLPPPELKWECAMWVYKSYNEAGRFLPLPKAKQNALGDARATLKIIREMAKG